MTMPLHFPKRATLLTGALLTTSLLANMACANNRTNADTTPNTDASATVMGQATPSGDDVSRAPSSDQRAAAAADTAVPSVGVTNRNMSEPGTPDTTFSGTSYGVDRGQREPASIDAQSDTDVNRKKHRKAKKKNAPKAAPANEAPPSDTGTMDSAPAPSGGESNTNMSQNADPAADSNSATSIDKTPELASNARLEDLSMDRTPAAVDPAAGTANDPVSITDQTISDRQDLRREARDQAQDQNQASDSPRERNDRGPTSIFIVSAPEPELSSRLKAMGAPSVDITDDNNPARLGLTPTMDTEPYSRIPYQVGSVQVTGKDKSVAVLERTNRFTDPNALARNESSHDAIAKIQNVDFGKYSHDKVGSFQSAMNSRLDNLGNQIDMLRAQAKVSTELPRSQVNQVLTDLEARRDAAAKTVDFADTISSDRWTTYRSDFRSQLMSLEQSLAQLTTAMR